jgi:PAS domain S-box-containing protein
MSTMSMNGDVNRHGKADDVALGGYGAVKIAGQSLWGDSLNRGLLKPDQRLMLDFIVSEKAGLLFLVMDAKEKILSCNTALELLTGWTAEDICGKYLWDIFMPFDGDSGHNALSGRRQRGKFPCEYENYIITRNGARKYTVWRGARLMEKESGDERVALAGLDITEMKKQEARLCKKINHLITHAKPGAPEFAETENDENTPQPVSSTLSRPGS